MGKLTTLRVDHELGVMIEGLSGPQVHDRPDLDERDSGGRNVGGRVARLAELRAAGLVRRASERIDVAMERSLPVAAPLRSLLPGGSLRRGGTVAVASGSGSAALSSGGPFPLSSGSTSLLFALLAEASSAGSWCAVVGLPRLGLIAAAEAGIAVERFALVPHPGPDWPGVVAALLDGVDIVVAATLGPVSAQVASRLTARARQRGVVLVPVGRRWPGADITLEVADAVWHGLGQGRGRLRSREMEVVAHGRGAAARPRRVRLWIPAAPGSSVAPSRNTTAFEGLAAPPVPLYEWDTVSALDLAG